MKHIFNKSTLNLLIAVSFVLANNNVFSQEEMEHHWGIIEMDNLITKNAPHPKHSFTNPNKSVRIEKTSMGTFFVNPNFMIHPNPNTEQAEVIITRNREFPNIMFGSSITFWPPGGPIAGKSQGIYVSTDGGLNWFGSDTINTGAPTPQPGSDPSPVIDKDGRFILTSVWFSGGVAAGVMSNFSTDNGLSWSAPYTLMGGTTPDKNMSATDDISTSPYYGRTYTAWVVLGSRYTAFSYTTNGGVSWSTPAQVNNPPLGRYTIGVDVRTGINGEVYLVWPVSVTSAPFPEVYQGFAKSTNGGISWVVSDSIYDVNGIRGFLPSKGNIRVNSWPRMDVDKTGGPRNGWIYVVGCDKNLPPSGSDPDIILHRSTDGGATWSSAIRVNQDPLNNGAIQFFPAITVDDSGGINIVYYDDRNVGGNLVEVFISRSTDGGDTWVDFPVSDHSFAPGPIMSFTNGFMGDYIGICYSNGKLWPFWMDNYSGYSQAWTTSVEIYPTNHSPFFTTQVTDTLALVDSLYQTVLTAQDADGDTLVFSMLQNPGFLSLQQVDSVSVRILGTPALADTGYHLVRIMVSDGRGGADTTEWTLNVITSPTSVQQLSSLPTEFALHQNYPNPFNPTTVIRYQLPVGQDGILSNYVTLKIFNLLGQEVATLVNEVKQPGSYEVTWDASGFASGVYLYRLQAGNYIDSKKLILLK